MLAPLTPRQKQILEFINLYQQMHKLAPSLEEIRDHFNLKAISTVHEHVEKLKKKGYLRKEMNQARSIRAVTDEELAENMIEIDVLGKIAAGEPIEPIEIPEPIVVSKDILPTQGQFYGLEVKGDSMIDDGIHEGDIVIIKSQSYANKGEVVVAIIKDNGEDEATLKHYDTERDRVKLIPANPRLKPMYYKDVEIRGKLVALVRQY